MIYKVLTKDGFRRLVELLRADNEVVAPRLVSQGHGGKPIYQFLPVDGFEDICLDYDKTEYSAKTYFLPFKENLSRYTFAGDDWEQHIHYRIRPRAIVGLHACDINALVKLDKVLLTGDFPS
ncbi:MAG: hydrogenase, partial [Deltaproteobacteria bacterium]|nr:hydrogenase [Deltaproteobacteria bacterium]